MPRGSRLRTPSKSPHRHRGTDRQPTEHGAALARAPEALTSVRALLPSQGSAIARQLQTTVGNRVIQRALVQREEDDDVPTEFIEMDPMVIRGYRGDTVEENIGGLEALTTQTAEDFEAERGEEHLRGNSPIPGDLLPYTEAGWDATAILTALGQHDRIAGTDSDADRCVQAVAMASYIPQGPGAVASYLNAVTMDGIAGRTLGDRQRVALRVIAYVRDRIRDREATFGDLSWAQEAVHDLFYTDVEGTPEEQVAQQITPGLANLLRRTESLDVWCSTAQQLATLAATLAPGGELMASTWTVGFNSAFDDLEEQGIPARSPVEVEVDGRTVRIARINAASKPNAQDIDPNRDHRSGHQIMIMRDNVQDGPLSLYEPEATRSGQHLATFDPGGMGEYFQDMPDIETYDYVHVHGRVIPTVLPGIPNEG